MVVDASAVVAIVLEEPSASNLVDVMKRATSLRISVATLLEASIVMGRRRGAAGITEVDDMLSGLRVSAETVTLAQVYTARAAFLRFGKGRHPAALNFGDCFSYALAKHHDEPLLFVGDDFARTDVRQAVG